MPITLAHLAVVLLWVGTTGCVGLGGGASPVVPDEVKALQPTEPGTYRMVGTERDSRTGRSRRVVETYTVDPHFTRSGQQRQITRYRDSAGSTRTWETAFRRSGAYRIHESADGSSWDWRPPLLTVATPMRVGRTWTANSTALLPDVAGTRRLTSVAVRSRVAAATTISVAGERVFVFVVDATVSTTVADTSRVDRASTTSVTSTRARSWFSPRHMLIVKSATTTTVRSGQGGAGRHVVVRQVQINSL